MPNPCYHHPQGVGARMACRRCAGALKDRLAAQTAAPASRPAAGVYPDVNPGVNPSYDPNAGLNYASGPANFVDTTPLPKITPARLLLGVGVAGAASLLGSLGIEKLLFYSHFGFPFLYLIVAATVSGCLRACTGRGGAAMAVTAGAVMAVGLGVSHLVYVQDMLGRARDLGHADVGVSFSDALPAVLGSLSFLHWMLVAAAVVMAGVASNRESKPGF